jgi:hypothetical protein
MRTLGRSWLVLVCAMTAGCAGKVDMCTAGTTGGTAAAGTSAGGSAAISGTPAADRSALIPVYAFDRSSQGFVFNSLPAPDPYMNLVAPGDAGVASPATSLDWSGSVDYNPASTTKGSLKITATFSDWGQQIQVEQPRLLDSWGEADLRNKILHAKVRLDSGLSPMAKLPVPCVPGECGPGGCVLYLKSAMSYDWGQGTWQNLTTWGVWTDIVFDTSGPDPQGSTAGFDASLTMTLGIQFFSGSGLGMGEFGSPLATTIYVDDIAMEP